ncbi:ParA family protein [Roseicyclus mahoneyensis]|jgi:chromosome partitioning protein|uniref:Chromosome partitioning protein n=1 Tax=Roseicyclus mahoneyensis TaxID=164332 RepID=A0A316GIN1_9RHOB|nr:ParA family protein [Roseicyclus mahoneyensis]PWK60384.1 chromosome partitioning protein [Roseicyclus mahoneyensis]
MRVLVFNQKGGVGKTTTTINLGAALLRQGVGRVVLADLDPQMHLTAGLGHMRPAFGWHVTDWLAGRAGSPLATAEPGLWLVPGSSIDDQTIPDSPPDDFGADWLVLDAPPTWSPRLGKIMAQADLILCPLEPDFLGLQGLNRLLHTMTEAGVARDRLRLLLTRFDPRLGVHREVQARLMARFGGAVLRCAIRRSVRLSEAPGYGVSVFGHAPRCGGALDYLALAQALTQQTVAREEAR